MKLLVTGIVIGVLIASVGLGRARGEFRREVPRWWIPQALCVKSHEGGWHSNTGNGFFGGFQMNRQFQRTYGGDIYRRFGTANNWHPRTQMIVAWRGYRSRGWSPWPTTRRMCGL